MNLVRVKKIQQNTLKILIHAHGLINIEGLINKPQILDLEVFIIKSDN